MTEAEKKMTSEQEDIEKGLTHAGTNSARMRRQLSDSVYLWACGEKAHDEDDDPKLSDRLIGWLVLILQGFAYTMLIVLAKPTSNSDSGSSADDSSGASYLLPSVTGAMYLLVASTANDLRAGYSLLMDGSAAGHRAFGAGLLIVYGIMISAAMTVLVSTSDDSASVVLNAVTVLFVADLDEKTLKFLSTVPQKWRLFWAIECIGISFVLALIAIVYLGDDSSLLKGSNKNITHFIPTWGYWIVSPAAVTWCSFRLSTTIEAVSEWSEAGESFDQLTSSVFLSRAFVRVREAIKNARERLRAELWFYVLILAWLVFGVVGWVAFSEPYVVPFAFVIYDITSPGDDSRLPIHSLSLICPNVMIAAGLATKALWKFLPKRERVTAIPEPTLPAEGNLPIGTLGNDYSDSRVPCLLVGWGVGFWVISLLILLGCSLPSGGCGWHDPPVAVTIIGYTVFPCFLVLGVLMLAGPNVLGTRFGAIVKPAVTIMQKRGSVVYWVLATVLRDVIIVWIKICLTL